MTILTHQLCDILSTCSAGLKAACAISLRPRPPLLLVMAAHNNNCSSLIQCASPGGQVQSCACCPVFLVHAVLRLFTYLLFSVRPGLRRCEPSFCSVHCHAQRARAVAPCFATGSLPQRQHHNMIVCVCAELLQTFWEAARRIGFEEGEPD